MNPSPQRRLFFAGTDTDVGKTYVASLAVAELLHSGQTVAVYKPVASGCQWSGDELVSADAVALWRASGQRNSLYDVCPQRFVAPLAPPAAAAAEQRSVDPELLLSGIQRVSGGATYVVVEGAGGLLSPLSDHQLNSDVAAKLDCELVITAANRLGAIHQVLSTVLAAKALGLPLLGIILTQVTEQADLSVASNAALIGRFTSIPILAEIAWGAQRTGVDWSTLEPARRPAANIAQAWL
jgi:dethiobiotin synthetase